MEETTESVGFTLLIKKCEKEEKHHSDKIIRRVERDLVKLRKSILLKPSKMDLHNPSFIYTQFHGKIQYKDFNIVIHFFFF